MVNEISGNFPSQFFITTITTSFENNFDQPSINNSFEAEQLEPDPTFENTINDIKYNYLKSVASADTNPSDITSFDENFDPLFINNSFEAAKFKPEPTFGNTINEIKANHLKSITSIDMNVSAITSNKPSLSYEHIKSNLMPWILLQSPEKSPQFTNHLSSCTLMETPNYIFETGGFLLDQRYIFSILGHNFGNTSQ